ncbi:hypothetical protein [Shewanella salipaludis]|uniref:Uncharacterized protein n=1 Tax=Shewanella salipaludis TaxID=2723052 RepID=A0A972FZ94_9GAMM|nr:hypothetical protein [Shewanella salipaludis]NMH65938.1 hypothetical protein [Shewanella salipaludis]
MTLTVVSGGEEHTLGVVTDGSLHTLKVRIFEDFTATVKAAEALNQKERDSLIEFCEGNSDFIQDGLERLIDEIDRLNHVHTYITDIFQNLNVSPSAIDVLVELLSQLLG